MPPVVACSDEFLSLTDLQQQSFARRCSGAMLLGRSLADESRLLLLGDFSEFAMDLELDVALMQEFDAAFGPELSRWQIHHSWSLETSPERMANLLSQEIIALVDMREPERVATTDEYRIWFREFGRKLVELLEQFRASESFAAAVAMHVVLDTMLARLLVACYKLRISPAVSS
jgi:hypothetical protein